MRKILTISFLLIIFVLMCGAPIKSGMEEDEFWKLAELADQADKENFREYIGKARKASEIWSFVEAEYYLKEAKKYIVDFKRDKDEYENLKNTIEKEKKLKFEYELKKNGEGNLMEEGEVIVNGVESSNTEIVEETDYIFEKTPVYIRKESLSGEVKYILRYKQMFYRFSYDDLKNQYWIDDGKIITFQSFIEVMKYAMKEVNYDGNVSDCLEVEESIIYLR